MLFISKVIRRKLIKDGQLAKYSAYAFGEIILIVFGILIALQLNQLNETSKNQDTELKILRLLSQDLSTNIEDFERLIEFSKVVVQANNDVLTLLNTTDAVFKPEHATQFGMTLRFGDIRPSRQAYEAIRNKDGSAISNIEVRNVVTDLFDDVYLSRLESIWDWQRLRYQSSSDIFNKHFLTGDSVLEKIPNDFNDLKNNQHFKNVISMLLADSKGLVRIHEDILRQTKEVKRIVDAEIDRLSGSSHS